MRIPVHLTRREVHVMWLYVQGLAHEKIAELLGLTPETVERYVRSAQQKLNRDRPSAVRLS